MEASEIKTALDLMVLGIAVETSREEIDFIREYLRIPVTETSISDKSDRVYISMDPKDYDRVSYITIDVIKRALQYCMVSYE